ncbi:MAG: hypothetical protein H0S79_24425, partial [Anaerolineaceae bacterium]|nr:hypothetical protein [Anaerolineaceae bacterium]
MNPKTHTRVRTFALFTLFLLLLTTGCQNLTPTTALPTEATQAASQPQASETASPEEASQPTEEASTTDSPDNAPTETALTPAPTLEDWREAPIMPEISDRVVEIYEEG